MDINLGSRGTSRKIVIDIFINFGIIVSMKMKFTKDIPTKNFVMEVKRLLLENTDIISVNIREMRDKV